MACQLDLIIVYYRTLLLYLEISCHTFDLNDVSKIDETIKNLMRLLLYYVNTI